MKKLITIILILALALPTAACAEDYSPALGMYLNDFINQYNAISAPLDSPYNKLDKSYNISANEEYVYFWFEPAKNSSAVLFLGTKGTDYDNFGIDLIQIGTNKSEDLIDIMSIATRCADLFAVDLLGTKMSAMRVGSVIRYYYENRLKGTGRVAYYTLDNDEKYIIAFFESDGWYYFEINTAEAYR